MSKNWFLKVSTLVIAMLFLGAMVLVPQVRADEEERDADWLTYPYTGIYGGGLYGGGLYGGSLYGGGLYGGGLYGGGLYGGSIYGGSLYGGGLYGGSIYGGSIYGGSIYGGGIYGGGIYGGGLYGGGLYGGGLYGGLYGGWGSLYSRANPFGIQNMYYPIDTGNGFSYQVPFVQIAPYLGMASLYNQLFPNLFDFSTDTTVNVLP